MEARGQLVHHLDPDLRELGDQMEEAVLGDAQGREIVGATTVAVRGTSHRIAISPMMSFLCRLATLTAPSRCRP